MILNKYIVFGVLPTSFFITTTVLAVLTCSNPTTACVEAGGTRYFENVPVTLDCWRYRTTYECRETSDNNCKQLRDQGCSQIKAECRTTGAGRCLVQDATYKCPVEQCNEAGDIVCGKDLFCSGGDCAATTPTKNQNFDKAASSLAALAAAAKEVGEQNTMNPIIFAGKAMECSENMIGAKNCCGISSSGWAEGIFLNCSDDEKELAKSKESNTAIDIGRYCHNEVLGVCTSHHRVYCVFDSKIARIVQNDGRKNQLGIGFGRVGGDSANPDCRGVTPEELSRMKFDQMDFSPLYNDIRAKAAKSLPNNEEISKKAAGSGLEDLKEKSSKGISASEPNFDQKAADRVKEFYDRTKK